MVMEEQVSTIYVAGFPADFTEREFQLMFTFSTNFETAVLKKNELLIGFVKFKTFEDAMEAKNVLNNMKIDNKILKAEIATRNLQMVEMDIPKTFHHNHRTSKDYGSFDPFFNSALFNILPMDVSGDQVIRENAHSKNPIQPPERSFRPEFLPNVNSSGGLTRSYERAYEKTTSPFQYNSYNSTPAPRHQLNQISRRSTPIGENPPCNTLYVGNLPMSVCEDELRNLFSQVVGFRRMSFRTKANGPMCFVEFEDISYATACMNNMYGTILTSSTKGGIRLSYSKNPLGVRSPSQNMDRKPFIVK